MEDQKVTLTVADPISVDIQEICKAVQSIMTFLATPEGQETIKAWRASSELFNSSIAKAVAWIQNLFKR